MAPTYAVLVIGFLEKQLYKKCEDKYGKAERKNFIKEFKRFSDDYFLLWKRSEEELQEFYCLLDNLHPKIHPENLPIVGLWRCLTTANLSNPKSSIRLIAKERRLIEFQLTSKSKIIIII